MEVRGKISEKPMVIKYRFSKLLLHRIFCRCLGTFGISTFCSKLRTVFENHQNGLIFVVVKRDF